MTACLSSVPGGEKVCRCAKCLLARGADLAWAYEDVRRQLFAKGEELYEVAKDRDALAERLEFSDPQAQEIARIKADVTRQVDMQTQDVKRTAGNRARHWERRYHQEVKSKKAIKGLLNEAIHLLKHARFFGHPDHPKAHPKILDRLCTARRKLSE